MKFEDTKHKCPDFIKQKQDQSLYAFKWVACKNGYRTGSYYFCELANLYCPHHWIEK